MTPAFIPVWILLAPLVLVIADWLFAPKDTSMAGRHQGPIYGESPSFVTR